ncbi:hypothetical protein RP20_CCG020939 [Aedes albopictus]|nr:hypothetical protein RP20_CCG020939 [Aedes albopictus]
MASTEIVCRYQTEHNLKRTMLCDNKAFRIPVFVDCDAVTVRVLDLPPSVSNTAVSEFMLKFGEVISIRDETWKHYFAGMPNGVRVLRMNLFRDIPSTVSIQNEKTMVVYPNQPKSTGTSHPGEKCSDPNPTIVIEIPSAASSPSSDLFSQADFPPIVNQQHNSPSLAPNASSSVPIVEEDWTDIEDNDSNSSTDYSVVTHKRRRSRKQEKNDDKNACNGSRNDQCSSNTCHIAERIIDILSKEKVFSVKNKKGKFS